GKVPLLVEIKHHAGAKLTSQLAYSLLKKYKGDYTVESFHPLSLYLFKKNAPNVIRGQLSSGIFHKNDLKSPIARFVMKYMLTNIISSPHFIAYNSASDDNLSMKLMKHLFKPTLAAYTLKTQQELDDAINKGYTMLIFEGFKPEL
ncbi:MAG: glycerophosphodiester phosphodiesterase, partial [Christensenellaceae bacterium]|nr:glycerophosphodiester phosphodiesterase [Christensenellaceae bacterium]